LRRQGSVQKEGSAAQPRQDTDCLLGHHALDEAPTRIAYFVGTHRGLISQVDGFVLNVHPEPCIPKADADPVKEGKAVAGVDHKTAGVIAKD
jgi:hypothetical protein